MSIQRFAVLLFCVATSAYSQLLSFGVKGGIPLTDPLNTSSAENGGVTHGIRRYVVGATGELHLPFGFSVEADALYRRVGFDVNATSLASFLSGQAVTDTRSTGNDWQFPVLAKYAFRNPLVRPFVDAGITFRNLDFSNITISDPNGAGVTIGGGIELKLLFVRVSPEIRYTHFGEDVFGGNSNLIHSTSNQVDFLVGVTS